MYAGGRGISLFYEVTTLVLCDYYLLNFKFIMHLLRLAWSAYLGLDINLAYFPILHESLSESIGTFILAMSSLLKRYPFGSKTKILFSSYELISPY